MMKVIKAEATSTRRLRNVLDGEAEMLQQFEFNVIAQLSNTLFAQHTPNIHRSSGAVAAYKNWRFVCTRKNIRDMIVLKIKNK